MLPYMLYGDFESILKPVDEWYREKMNRVKTERKGKVAYTEKINTCTIRMVCTQHLYLCP